MDQRSYSIEQNGEKELEHLGRRQSSGYFSLADHPQLPEIFFLIPLMITGDLDIFFKAVMGFDMMKQAGVSLLQNF